ncbi:MAG: ABC transporter permease [Treponema sp.]|nr:ABC transporter permease [Treponema sp.]
MMDILIMAAPLVLVTVGALVSEYAGRMALFLDGAINLGAFLCFLYTVQTGSVTVGCLLALGSVTACILLCARIVERTDAAPFIASLAVNLFCNALVSLLSSLTFGTRGVLTDSAFIFSVPQAQLWTTLGAYVAATLIVTLLFTTRSGLYLRITGTDSAVLISRGIDASWNRTHAWCIAAACGALAGSFLAIRLSSFVPNGAGGRGWIALACVFLGKKRVLPVISAAILFCLIQYATYTLPIVQHIAPSLLIALPYVAILFLIAAAPDTSSS